MKRTINNQPEIEASIQAISAAVPAIKPSEVIAYSYKEMSNDLRNGVIDDTIWDSLRMLRFDDAETEGASTRGCRIDDIDYDIVVTSYAGDPGTGKVSLMNMTKLVLFYERKKMEKKKDTDHLMAFIKMLCSLKDIPSEDSDSCSDETGDKSVNETGVTTATESAVDAGVQSTLELMQQITDRGAKLILEKRFDKIQEFLAD